MALVSTQSLTEMSTRNLPGGKGRPARKPDNLTAICEPIVYIMNVPRRLTTLWASMACYRDSFTLPLPFIMGNMYTPFIRPYFTCFGSLSHHQAYDLFTLTCIRLLVFLHWSVFIYWNTGFLVICHADTYKKGCSHFKLNFKRQICSCA
jgi:hypothetical protein